MEPLGKQTVYRHAPSQTSSKPVNGMKYAVEEVEGKPGRVCMLEQRRLRSLERSTALGVQRQRDGGSRAKKKNRSDELRASICVLGVSPGEQTLVCVQML